MKSSANLEVNVYRRSEGSYSIILRCTPPGGEVDISRAGEAQVDFERLRASAQDTLSYATLLTRDLFKDPVVASAFGEARSTAQVLNASLRIQLDIASNAPELQTLHWETLLDPRDGSYLFAGEQILFSRYLSSQDWQPVDLREQTQVTALVVIANPANLAEFQLTPVDVQGESLRAQASMHGIGVTTLASAGTATLSNLAARLRDGGHDILYLVCHGSIVDGVPWLWMEDEAGKVARVHGSTLVARLKELRQRPRLVVLASCQSAGDSDGINTGPGSSLVALGPQLAAAGIPSVLAMQGSVSMKTVADFMPVFFRELLRDGQIDRAVAVARGAVSDRPDFWMPVLFMRLKNGCIWHAQSNADRPRVEPSPPPPARESHRAQNLLFASIAGWLVVLALLALVLGPSRVLGLGALELPAILAIAGVCGIVLLPPRPPMVRAGMIILPAILAIGGIDRLIVLQRPSQYRFSASILVMLVILAMVWLILVHRWPTLPVLSTGLLATVPIAAIGWLIPLPKEFSVNIVPSSFQANGQRLGPLANGQPAQYTGSCPVNLTFGWNMTSAMSPDVKYQVLVGANGQDVYQSASKIVHLPGSNIPAPISQGFSFKTNTDTGLAQIISPGLSDSGIPFIIHCTPDHISMPAPSPLVSHPPVGTRSTTPALPPGLDPGLSDLYHRALAGDANAMFDLATDYRHGQGTAKDDVNAVVWYRKAAEGGHAQAMKNLGFMYEHGFGVTKDYSQAINWYLKAAEAGNSDAMDSLGAMYLNGYGVEKDYRQAVSWYRKAAEAGNPLGMNNLGFMYENGHGVTTSKSQAISWYRKAAELGNQESIHNLKRLGLSSE